MLSEAVVVGGVGFHEDGAAGGGAGFIDDDGDFAGEFFVVGVAGVEPVDGADDQHVGFDLFDVPHHPGAVLGAGPPLTRTPP